MRAGWIAILMSLCMAGAQAQSWPAKPVHIIVNVAPAGTADVTARLLAPRLAEAESERYAKLVPEIGLAK